MARNILAEAKRLYDLGFAIHWLHPNSKRPVESAWTTGPRKSWEQLASTYKEGMNVGVRLGKPSNIGGNFLSVIDVDVKSSEERHAKEVAAALDGLTKGHKLPEVKSGRGNGSKHYYVLTSEPVKPFKALQSKDIVKVLMPSVSPSKRELNGYGGLTPNDIALGYRARPAWEVGIMGDGQQVVLPPSIHPDSGKPYAWQSNFDKEAAENFDIACIPRPEENSSDASKKEITLVDSETVQKTFIPEDVDLEWLPNLSDKMRSMIMTGEGVEDRSASLLPASKALLKAGLSTNEILSVLTNPKYYLGQVGYHHAETQNRARAAKWVYKYSVKKIINEHGPEALFSAPMPEPKEVSFDEITSSESEFDFDHWTNDLDMTDKGVYRSTLKNVVEILAHVVGIDFVRRDLFAYRDAYAYETPWGGEAGKALTDDDMTLIKMWLSQHWGFEPSVFIISEALAVLAVKNAYDPVVDWLNELPDWDGVERLDTWLVKHFEAGKKTKRKEPGCDDYHAQVFRKWIFGMVLRAFKPGAHFPWMPIFEGLQGIGKSSFGRILVGEKYFLDQLPDLSDKDASLALQGSWAVEMGELASMRKNEIEVVKGFLTRKIDKFRPPHGRKSIESPRRCVFFGTTNNETYLKDTSGNRRFKPVEVGTLDFEQLAEDRDQLFAEALWLYRTGFESEATVELTGPAAAFEKSIQRDKMVQDESDLMADEIVLFFDTQKDLPDGAKIDPKNFTTRELFGTGTYSGPIHKWRFDARNVQFAGKALKKLGAKKFHTVKGNRWRLDGF